MFPVSQTSAQTAAIPDDQSTLRSQQLLVAKLAQGYIPRDMQARLGVSGCEREMKLLGGRRIVFQGNTILKPNQTFSTETNRDGRKVFINTGGASVHVTILYKGPYDPLDMDPQVIISAPFAGEKNFAPGPKIGKYQVTIKNTDNKDQNIYIHVEEESSDGNDCSIS